MVNVILMGMKSSKQEVADRMKEVFGEKYKDADNK